MSNQTSEAFAYIEREYKDVKDRVELQRRVVEQPHVLHRRPDLLQHRRVAEHDDRQWNGIERRFGRRRSRMRERAQRNYGQARWWCNRMRRRDRIITVN
jgi:hypothetical protein